jgi:radical SAM superfamily enzyme YgiQ (UPF0313 family)
MATVPFAQRQNFWRSFDLRYHAAHPGLRHMKNALWELPHWMHWLGGLLIDAGFHDLDAVDLYSSACTLDGIDQKRFETILRQHPGDIFLFSPMTPNLAFAYEIAALVKQLYPDSFTIFGGVVATPLSHEVAAHPAVDYVVTGRGEYALPDLMRALDGRLSIPDVGNLVYKQRENDQIRVSAKRYPDMPVNNIPAPKIDLFDRSVGEDIRYLRQVYALGCPYRCSFCTIQTINQKADYFHLDRVIGEIHAYRKHYGEHHNVYFGDETFTVNVPRTMAICEALRADGTIHYDIQTRLNCLQDRQMLKALKESGCSWVEIGIETVNQNTQDFHKQRLRLTEMEDTLAAVRDAGIPACSFVVNGFPEQTLDDMRRSVDAICDLLQRGLLQATYFFGLVPYPGSLLFENPEQFGMRLLHQDFRLYHEELEPVYETRLAQSPQIHNVFLEGLVKLGQAMGCSSPMLKIPEDDASRAQYGAFWQGAHV